MKSSFLVLSLFAVSCASSPASPSSPSDGMPANAPTSASPQDKTASASPPTASTQTPTPSAITPSTSAPSAPLATPSSAPSAPVKSDTGAVLHLTQGKIANGDAALAGADEKVRACVASSKKPGEMEVKITITTSGWALSVDIKPTADVSKEAVSCAKKAMRDYTFGKPIDGGVAAAIGTFKVPGN